MIKTLYKRSKLGKVQSWMIVVEENKFRTLEGFKDGQITTSEWTVCKGKNIGSSNETTPEQQALKEAEAKITKKKEQGYTEEISDVDTAVQKIKPMLAHKWEDYKDKLQGLMIASQPKLDGIRCIATKEGLFTRNGKSITSVPHIWKEVQELLDELPSGTKIDGEIYNHELKEDFNEITSIVRKSKLTTEDLLKSESLLQYHIYDIDFPKQPFISRLSILIGVFDEPFVYLKLVDTKIIGDITEGSRRLNELDYLYGVYLEQGYEGQMVRTIDSNYENSRSKNLLKRKEFLDEEFEIIDIEEGLGNRSGMMGRIKFKMKNGNTFDSNARGTYEYFKELLVYKHRYIGKMAIVRFQNYTPDGSVRFPVMIAIRDYE